MPRLTIQKSNANDSNSIVLPSGYQQLKKIKIQSMVVSPMQGKFLSLRIPELTDMLGQNYCDIICTMTGPSVQKYQATNDSDWIEIPETDLWPKYFTLNITDELGNDYNGIYTCLIDFA